MGDTLFDIGPATWNGLAGSRLGIDADLDAALNADVLHVGAATGSTTVVLTDTAPTHAAALNFTGVPVAVASGGGPSTAFVMPPITSTSSISDIAAAAIEWVKLST